MIDNVFRCGDCFKLIKEVPDNSVDLVLSDPPYGMSYQSNVRTKKAKKIQNDNNVEDWLGS